MSTDPLPISLVAHTVFCPRRAWLEAAGETVESYAISSGVAAHRAVDERRDERALRKRSIDIESRELGLTGRCDVVEISDDGKSVSVVEFKSAPLRKSAEVTEAQRVQLTLQGACLREAGFEVVDHSVYFTGSRSTKRVEVDQLDRREAVRWVELTRATVEADRAPLPLVNDPRCGRCSHAGVCLPDERRQEVVRRRVIASDPQGTTLHAMTPGSRVSLRAGRVEVTRREEILGDVPLERVQALIIHGNVDVSGALTRELLWRGVPLVWCSFSGRVVGFASSANSPNGLVRINQHVASAQGEVRIAREIMAAKIANQATQLRRGARGDVSAVVAGMRENARRCAKSENVNELLGLEGAAAAAYFTNFTSMLGPRGSTFADRWRGRTGRSASDPLNVALNVAYGLLLAEAIRSLVSCGLDPHAGFIHSSSRNKPAMALDLMEEFRAPVADSSVIGAVNNGEVTERMFTDVLGSCRLRDGGRKALVKAFERRINQQFVHPTYGYKVTWRRAMEVQARMILGVLDGSQPSYLGVRTR